mgnify:CR=1 FL=1
MTQQRLFRIAIELDSRAMTSLDVWPTHSLPAKQAGRGVLALSLAVVTFTFVVNLLQVQEHRRQVDEGEGVICCEQQKIDWHEIHSIGSKSLIELRDAAFNELLTGICSQDIVIYRSLKQILWIFQIQKLLNN